MTVIFSFSGLCLFLPVFSVFLHTNFAPCFELSLHFLTVSYSRTSQGHQVVLGYIRATVDVVSVHEESLRSANILPTIIT